MKGLKPLKDPFKYSFDRLEDIAEHISEVLNCPITIEDVNHRLLAYSTHDDCTDPARISTIIGRRVPEKVINNLWKDGIIPKLLEKDEPIRVKQIDEVGLGNRVAISIWRNDEVLGFIWALEINKTLSEEELELLKMAAQAVKNKLLNLHARKTKREERNQEFFWKLLTGHISSHHEIEEGFHKVHVSIPSVYSVLIFKLQSEITDSIEKQLQYLLETTQKVQTLLWTIDFDQVIILIAPNEKQPLQDLKLFLQWAVTQLKERFMIQKVKTSIGGIYTDLTNIEKSYREALSVLSIKERFPNETEELDSYSELGIYQYLDIFYEKRRKDGFVNYSLNKLKEYDMKHHTNLVETLEVFLDNDSNVNIAAQNLNVHINTLSYRLKRIKQIAEIDLENPNHKMTMYLDIKIDKMHL
ncbi:PucR family transcriptional regulator [Bacillus sp. FJAT-47783]|uniref:PucR family transcriptional regulator n=1 Tax=Bacillus sp. FJAT-47783 TaxID=2922712 RepID=UPI001FAE457A|nr:PucR family transcriptional regulator [Bacillus sp. FJAT-47783]